MIFIVRSIHWRRSGARSPCMELQAAGRRTRLSIGWRRHKGRYNEANKANLTNAVSRHLLNLLRKLISAISTFYAFVELTPVGSVEIPSLCTLRLNAVHTKKPTALFRMRNGVIMPP